MQPERGPPAYDRRIRIRLLVIRSFLPLLAIQMHLGDRGHAMVKEKKRLAWLSGWRLKASRRLSNSPRYLVPLIEWG